MRVYSEETWKLYERLDQTINPRGPDLLHTLAAEYITPGSSLLDAGCRDAAHLIRLVTTHQVSGVGVDPVPLHVERARAAVESAGLLSRIEILHGRMDDLPHPEAYFDFVWCRDVLEQVESLSSALGGVARVLKPGGHMLVYTTVATDLLEPGEMRLLAQHMGNVTENLFVENLEMAFDGAGLIVEGKDTIGTEWREFAEERTKPASAALLRLARLRRQRDSIVAACGEDIYLHVEANLHWEVFQFLGKLCPIVYVLRRGTRIEGPQG